MSTLIPCKECPNISDSQSIGFGSDSLGLESYYYNIVSELRKAETLGRLDETLQSLYEVFSECSEEGWDGYDAYPITEGAYFEARKFIKSLPLISIIPMPKIAPEPSGEICLEWFKGNHQVLVISVSGKNEIIYAGLFGINKTHGTEYFGDSMPSAVMENLKRLYY